jgi:hypothetical protein
MTSRFSIFSHFKNPLFDTEIDADSTPRNWVLNGYGTAEFSLSLSNPKATEPNLRFGNLVHIEHIPTKDAAGNINGTLPTWTGILLPLNRDWSLGVIHCKAASMEALLTARPLPWTKVTGKPADIFTQIIRFTNETKYNTIPIKLGVVENLPITLSDEFRTNAYEHIRTLIKRSGMDWSITGKINDNGALELTTNLYQRKGVQTGFVMDETNTQGTPDQPMLSEQGSITNVIFGHSQASTDSSRFNAVAVNQESVDKYGFFGANETFLGLRDSAGVSSAALVKATIRGEPVKIIPKRIVLDKGNAFDNLDTGNIGTVRNAVTGFMPDGSIGTEAEARILSIDYNDLSNNAPVNLEVL